MTEEAGKLAELAERFISQQMKWAPHTPEELKTYVACNVRGFASWAAGRLKGLEPGVYWVRQSNTTALARPFISEWNGEKWFHFGVEDGDDFDRYEVLSPRLEFPTPAP